MPSALRSSMISWSGRSQIKPAKPRMSRITHAAASLRPSDLMRRVLTAVLRLSIAARVSRAKIIASIRISVQADEIIAAILAASCFLLPAGRLVDALQGAIDGVARGPSGDHGHQDGLQKNAEIAGYSGGKAAEQGARLVAAGGA